jgi:hypothetical protein
VRLCQTPEKRKASGISIELVLGVDLPSAERHRHLTFRHFLHILLRGIKRGFDIAVVIQTNVYPSAQRRKLKEFDGYRRVAVVVVTDSDTYRERFATRASADGKEVPDGAIVDMKG